MYSGSCFVFGISDIPRADGWMIDRCLNDEFTEDSMEPRREDNVGVYEDIAYSPICESFESELYMPAACIGRSASGPVKHHHRRGSTFG
jgi:hypothetical protein